MRLPHPVETPHKKRAVSHLCTHRLCLAVGMCVPHHIVQFRCPQVIQVEVWPDHAAISSQLYVCPSFQWKPGCDRDELLIWAKTNLSKYLFKKNPTVTLVSMSHSSIWDQQEKYATSHQMWHLLIYPKEWDAARRCIQMQNQRNTSRSQSTGWAKLLFLPTYLSINKLPLHPDLNPDILISSGIPGTEIKKTNPRLFPL